MIRFFYILKELLLPFLLTALVLVAILLMEKIYQFLPYYVSSGVSITAFLLLLLYSLPTIFSVVFPISLTMGIFTGMFRLSSDSEVVSMRAAGISLVSLFTPVLAFAVLVSILTGMMTLYLNPLAVTGLKNLQFSILQQQTRINIEPGHVNTSVGENLLFVAKQSEDELYGIFIADKNNPDQFPLIEARKGKIEISKEELRVLLHLADGKIHLPGDIEHARTIAFKRFQYYLNIPYIKTKRKKRHEWEYSTIELINILKKTPPHTNTFFEYSTELHSRLSTPLSCFVLALFALPIGIGNRVRKKAGGIIKLLLLMFGYFSIFVQARALSDRGAASAYILYLPPLITACLGIIYFFKANYDLDSIREMVMVFFSPSQKTRLKK